MFYILNWNWTGESIQLSELGVGLGYGPNPKQTGRCKNSLSFSVRARLKWVQIIGSNAKKTADPNRAAQRVNTETGSTLMNH